MNSSLKMLAVAMLCLACTACSAARGATGIHKEAIPFPGGYQLPPCDMKVYDRDPRRVFDVALLPVAYGREDFTDVHDDPSCFTEYKESTAGFSFSVPYNPAWGNAQYKVPPFVTDASGTVFLGRLGMTGQGLQRSFAVRQSEKRSIEVIFQSVENFRKANQDVCVVGAFAYTLNGTQGVKYSYSCDEEHGDLEENVFEIIGPRFNLVFSGWRDGQSMITAVGSASFLP